jgi:hypothetical protein
MRMLSHLTRCSLLALAMTCLTASAQEPKVADESRLKLAYLFNFVQFVEWPPASLSGDNNIRLCVVGDDPFGSNLDQLAGRPVRGRTLQVQRPSRLEDIRSCHLVYVDKLSSPGVPPRLSEALRDNALLLVSSDPGAASRGATIEFVAQGNRLRWYLNLDTARQSGLRISAKLVELSLPAPGGRG